jgi:hypothetical protein
MRITIGQFDTAFDIAIDEVEDRADRVDWVESAL